MKKILTTASAAAACISMITFTAFASSTENSETFSDETTTRIEQAEQSVYTISLEQAIEMAITDNPQLTSCTVRQESNRINLDAAKKSQSKYKNAPVSASNYETMYLKKGYYIHTYEMMMRLNTKEYEQIKSKISYDVTQSYYNYKIASSMTNISLEAYNLAKSNYDNVSKRYELGMIAELDLKNAMVSVSQCENEYNARLRNMDIARENLKINLQLDGQDCDFVLTDDISYEDFDTVLSQDIESAMGNRYDITSLKESYQLADEYFDLTKPLSESSAKYQTAYSDFISKQYAYTNNKKLIELSIRNSYNSVISAREALNLAEKSAQIAKQTYDINNLKFENGMITNSDLTASLNSYLGANISYENAKLTYKLAVEKYNYEISIGL